MHERFAQAATRQDGITYQQAWEIWERFHTNGQAAPAVADKMHIEYRTVCDCLDGKIWPAVRRYWHDNATVVSDFQPRAN